MKIVLSFLLVFLPLTADAVDCTVKCPKGYLGVCVEADGECTCRCAKDASAGTEAIVEILREKGASENAIRRAMNLYKNMAQDQVNEFSFTITDHKRTFTISGSSTLDVADVVVQR